MRLALFCLICLMALACSAPPETGSDEALLLALHESVLESHRNNDVNGLMAAEADTIVMANRGTVTFPPVPQRRTMREAYLGSTTFSVYRDLREPIVRISDDGTLAWVIAEVELRGVRTVNGTERTIDSIWAWVELYEKRGGEWKMTGNVSNSRPWEPQKES